MVKHGRGCLAHVANIGVSKQVFDAEPQDAAGSIGFFDVKDSDVRPWPAPKDRWIADHLPAFLPIA